MLDQTSGPSAVGTESDTIRHAKKRAFLAVYAETGNVKNAAESAGIHRSMHYTWLEEDAAYAAAFQQAAVQAADAIEAEAVRRAIEGDAEYVLHAGRVCYMTDECGNVVRGEDGQPVPLRKVRRSDRLLALLLRGQRPEKYAAVTQPQQVAHQDFVSFDLPDNGRRCPNADEPQIPGQ